MSETLEEIQNWQEKKRLAGEASVLINKTRSLSPMPQQQESAGRINANAVLPIPEKGKHRTAEDGCNADVRTVQQFLQAGQPYHGSADYSFSDRVQCKVFAGECTTERRRIAGCFYKKRVGISGETGVLSIAVLASL